MPIPLLPLLTDKSAMDQASLIRAWMRDVLANRPDLTPSSWAKLAGVAPSTVNKALKDDYQFVTSTRTLTKLAAASKSTPPNLESSGSVQREGVFLEVRYRAQAGSWAEVEDLSASYATTYPVAPDPRYSEFPQWLEEVVGDSADKMIPPGSFAHVVNSIELGYTPRHGDWVIVERCREQGRLRERSVKQVEITRTGQVELWPRSTNPRWSEPLSLDAGAENDDTIQVQIVGKVIGTYTPM